MSTKKHYATRDTEALGEHYLNHVAAMTAEGLHEKNHIAAELAWRDAEIARLSRPRDIDVDPFRPTVGVNDSTGGPADC